MAMYVQFNAEVNFGSILLPLFAGCTNGDFWSTSFQKKYFKCEINFFDDLMTQAFAHGPENQYIS